MFQIVAGIGTLSASAVQAQAEKLTEDDPYAKSMGFRLDNTRVDKVKFPRFDETQKCSQCQLFGGKPGDTQGPCSFFGDRLVNPNGWCRNFKRIKAA
jgi:hypothetical protein